MRIWGLSALRLPMESTKNCPEKDDVLTVIVNLLGFCWLPKWTVAGMGVTTVGHKAVAWSNRQQRSTLQLRRGA